MENRVDAGNGDSRVSLSGSDWTPCHRCRMLLYQKSFLRLEMVCPACGSHHRMAASERMAHLLDAESIRPIEAEPSVVDPLGFADVLPYADRLDSAWSSTGMDSAVQVVDAAIGGHQLVVATMDFRFLGGSMGAAEGAAIATAAETALRDRRPLLLVTASGGARMHEGVLSLMQMAKTSNAMAELDEAGLLTITLVTDPTYGGVAASFATLSDVIIAEPAARMGFAGPRVIEQTIRQRLPEGFQTSEALLDNGLIDTIRPRRELPRVIGMLLAAGKPPEGEWASDVVNPVLRDPESLTVKPIDRILKLARDQHRPTTMDHLAAWDSGFIELHGDRSGEDCAAIVGGLAELDRMPVMVLGHQKGHHTEELVRRDFGMSSPAGYRKAIRLMRIAVKLHIPLITLIDTPGAHPGLEAERGGQANAIADCLRVMGGLPIPVVAVITGEGGSGGALGLAVADRVLLCENAIYSVISPEGCAAILWRSRDATTSAATALGVDGRSLLALGVIDGVIPEPTGGAHLDSAAASGLVRDAVMCALRELRGQDGAQLVASRRRRFRNFGLAMRRDGVF